MVGGGPIIGSRIGVGFGGVTAVNGSGAQPTSAHASPAREPAMSRGTEHLVARLSDVPADRALIVRVNSMELGLFRTAGSVVAVRNVCPHEAAPVCRGVVAGTNLTSPVHTYIHGRDGEILQCPWHGWEFDLLTGDHLAQGSSARLRQFPVEIRGEDVYIRTRV